MENRKDQIQKLEKFQSGTPSTWRKEAEYRLINRDWIRESQRIATEMLIKMDEMNLKQSDLAKMMGVSQQYISKILKGKENLTLNTIVRIEEILHITILHPSHT